MFLFDRNDVLEGHQIFLQCDFFIMPFLQGAVVGERPELLQFDAIEEDHTVLRPCDLVFIVAA